MSKEKKEVDIRDQVLEALDGRTFTWLCTKTQINYSTLYGCLKHKTCQLSDENLAKINAVLKTNLKK